MNGRRGFLKTLSGIIGGIIVTPQMRVRAMERANALKYERKFRDSSVPPVKKPQSPICTGSLQVSGIYAVTGSWAPTVAVSGVYFPRMFSTGYVYPRPQEEL